MLRLQPIKSFGCNLVAIEPDKTMIGTTDNWLQSYLDESVRKNLCTQIHCTTCGAMEFRKGVFDFLMQARGQQLKNASEREKPVEIAKALAKVQPTSSDLLKFEEAIRCLLFDLCSGLPFLDNEIEAILSGSWAGDVLRRMQEHHKARQAVRRARAAFEAPENVQKRREEKKRLKQEQHQQRLVLKKERDRAWREKHGGISE